MKQVDLQMSPGHIELRYNDNFRFSCQRCGECCKKPGYFTPDSMEDVADHFGMDKDGFYEQFCEIAPEKTVITPRVSPDTGHCIFLEPDDDGYACSIHDIKPRNCSYSPMVMKRYKITDDFEMILNKNSLFALSRCPGAGKGKKHKVRDWVRRKGMADDMTFQYNLLFDIGIITGVREFAEILRKKQSDSEVFWKDESRVNKDICLDQKMKKAIEQAYGIGPAEMIIEF